MAAQVMSRRGEIDCCQRDGSSENIAILANNGPAMGEACRFELAASTGSLNSRSSTQK